MFDDALRMAFAAMAVGLGVLARKRQSAAVLAGGVFAVTAGAVIEQWAISGDALRSIVAEPLTSLRIVVNVLLFTVSYRNWNLHGFFFS